MSVLNGFEPQEVFDIFEEICAIPHGSGDTKRISDYLMNFAADHVLRAQQDDMGNVIIWKNGTKGYEASKTVMLQGHMDMVCEKDPGHEIDFASEGVSLRADDGVISAEGTTLGGDDGIAVAYTLAILASDEIPHPPLEAVFTVDEEIGMLGAAALDASPLKASYMINIDSEDEGYLLVSCAGGATAECQFPAEREEFEGRPALLAVCGGLGGHSGIEIDKGRSNSNQILGRVLYRISQAADFRIVFVEGGKKDNAIPAGSTARLVFANDADMAAVSGQIARLNEQLAGEFSATDPDVHVELQTDVPAGADEPLTEEVTGRVITALVNLPGGVQRMSFAMPGLVQTSLNMGILRTTDDAVEMEYSVRSSVGSEKDELIDRLISLTTALHGTVSVSGDYPAWEYREDSRLRELMVDVFEEQYGRKPVVHAIHAGVECGLFIGKMPALDCVSIGPDIKDVHTPREHMKAASVKRTWDFLLEVLRRLN